MWSTTLGTARESQTRPPPARVARGGEVLGCRPRALARAISCRGSPLRGLRSSSTQARERVCNTRRGFRALVHPLHEPPRARQAIEQLELLSYRRHVELVSRYKVGLRHVVADQ